MGLPTRTGAGRKIRKEGGREGGEGGRAGKEERREGERTYLQSASPKTTLPSDAQSILPFPQAPRHKSPSLPPPPPPPPRPPSAVVGAPPP